MGKIFCVKMHKRFFLQYHSIFDNIAEKSLINKVRIEKTWKHLILSKQDTKTKKETQNSINLGHAQ